MDPRFQPHNAHLEDPEAFELLDPQLRRLRKLPLVHRPALLTALPLEQPGIYTVGGGRQIGKTTLLKQWMAELMGKGVSPGSIAYFTGELIDDHHSLVRLVTDHLDSETGRVGVDSAASYLLLDEVSYIKDWDRGVKYLADAGMLENTVTVLTGSDLALLKQARMRFPGRRGSGDVVDFHLRSLSFRETVMLKGSLGKNEAEQVESGDPFVDRALVDRLYDRFDEYLHHGGFLTAINDMALHDRILPATLATYSDWIRGDVLKRGKQETYLVEVLSALFKRMGSQLTWNSLARELSIDHPKTVSEYVELLASMEVTIVQPALIEDKLAPAPKKARKITFCDPFIYHAIGSWLSPTADPFTEQIMPTVTDPERSSRLAESCATMHVHRLYPTYYIKAEGEIDIAYVDAGTFWPIEIKWYRQVRPKDLKQIAKYGNGRVWTRARTSGTLRGVPTTPLPVALFRLPC